MPGLSEACDWVLLAVEAGAFLDEWLAPGRPVQGTAREIQSVPVSNVWVAREQEESWPWHT